MFWGLLLPAAATAWAYYYAQKHRILWPTAAMGAIWALIFLGTMSGNFIIALASIFGTYKTLSFTWDKYRYEGGWTWSRSTWPQ